MVFDSGPPRRSSPNRSLRFISLSLEKRLAVRGLHCLISRLLGRPALRISSGGPNGGSMRSPDSMSGHMKRLRYARTLGMLLVGMAAVSHAQQAAPLGIPVPPLGPGPWVFDTAEQHRIQVSVVARLSHPWAIAFL